MSHYALHFTAAEMDPRGEADADDKANLRLVARLLDCVREAIDRPIIVTSGYRSPDHNAAVGGVPNSAHVLGWAVDVKSPGMKPSDLADAIEAVTPGFDQLIVYAGHVHVGYGPQIRRMRFNA